MSRPFEHPAHVPVPVALAVWRIMCQDGTRDERALAWEELDRHPRGVALGWVKDVLVANRCPRLDEELKWWWGQLCGPDN
jgi:hypothetical protein